MTKKFEGAKEAVAFVQGRITPEINQVFAPKVTREIDGSGQEVVSIAVAQEEDAEALTTFLLQDNAPVYHHDDENVAIVPIVFDVQKPK